MKHELRTMVFVLSMILASLFMIHPAYASTDLGQSQIHPAHPLYFLKAVREGLEMHLAQTSKIKAIRQLEFATRRIREIRSLTHVNRQDLIHSTLERYWVHVLSSLSKGEAELGGEITNSLVVHTQTLEGIYLKLSNLQAKMAVRSTLNRIMERVKLPISARMSICNLFIKEASSSALTETEQMVLKTRAEKCFSYL